MYCWRLVWRILSITLLVCEMSTIVWSFENSLALPFLEWKLTFSSSVASAEFSKFTGILNCPSAQFSRSVMSNSLGPHESQHTRPPCPSPTPGVYPNPRSLSWWCHPAISSSVVSFSSCPQSLPASGSFPMSQLFAWDGQSTGVSTSAWVLPMNTQDWSP